MKCIYRLLLYSLTLSLLSGTQLFWEDFLGNEIPLGWETEGDNWRVDSVGYNGHVVGDPSPGAFFYYAPEIYIWYERP